MFLVVGDKHPRRQEGDPLSEEVGVGGGGEYTILEDREAGGGSIHSWKTGVGVDGEE